MMDEYDRQAKRRSENRARQRQLARQRRAALDSEWQVGMPPAEAAAAPSTPMPRALRWLFSSRSPVAKLTGLAAVAVLVFFIGSYMLSGRIFPNVYAMGVALGDMTPAEAEAALLAKWETEVYIDLTVDGEIIAQATPEQLGLSVDVAAMAEQAKAAGMAGIPFGMDIAPAVIIDYAKAQSYLLNLTEIVYVLPYESGYRWTGTDLVTVRGREGKHLDTSLSLERLLADLPGVVLRQQFELQTIPLAPVVMDSSPFLEEAYAFLHDGIQMQGYDPYTHERLFWQIDQRTAAEWLAAGENGVVVRPDIFTDYITGINQLLVNSDRARYIDERLALEKMQDALDTNNPDVIMRVHYLPQPYFVEQKDTGFRIGRKNGIPYELIAQANPTVDWGVLVVGQEIQIPSRDELLPIDPVPHKRIIVDIESQWLVAFENDRMIFSWGISSGRETAPTYPGIFQILSHSEVAYGGSFALCDEVGTNCDQWEMAWFMGVYAVIPGLMNGFHGAVLLPNGGYLGGGGVYEPTTYGCIMSLDANARSLYDWAEQGTIVEILSEEFEPESELGRLALQYISSIDTSYRPTSA